MKVLRVLLLLVGLGFLVALVVENDPAAVFDSVTRLSWRLLVILVFSISASACADWNSTIGASNPLNWYRFDELDANAIDYGSQHLNGTYGIGAQDATRGVPGQRPGRNPRVPSDGHGDVTTAGDRARARSPAGWIACIVLIRAKPG